MSAIYEPIQLRTPSGLGVHIAATGGTRKFFLSPARNPDAPRLWCVRAEICAGNGEPDPEQPSVISTCELSYTEMVTTFRAIRAETNEWITAREQDGLRAWLVANDVQTALADETQTVAAGALQEENHAG